MIELKKEVARLKEALKKRRSAPDAAADGSGGAPDFSRNNERPKPHK